MTFCEGWKRGQEWRTSRPRVSRASFYRNVTKRSDRRHPLGFVPMLRPASLLQQSASSSICPQFETPSCSRQALGSQRDPRLNPGCLVSRVTLDKTPAAPRSLSSVLCKVRVILAPAASSAGKRKGIAEWMRTTRSHGAWHRGGIQSVGVAFRSHPVPRSGRQGLARWL